MSINKLFALSFLLLCLPLLGGGARAQTNERAKAAAEIESLREQIKAREAVLLAPAAEDQARYAEFLAQADTGLVRLLPREKWDYKLSTRGGGAFYSFARLTHEYGYGSDIMLEQGEFAVGFAGADFGMMVNLGDVPFESVTGETDGVKFLYDYRAPAAEKEARATHMSTYDGVHSGEWVYKSRLPAEAGRTYALRSINYNTSDVLVAFRVVRKDDDGSMVLLWKLLKKFPKPVLERSVQTAAAQ
jgi:hypothetical protein